MLPKDLLARPLLKIVVTGMINRLERGRLAVLETMYGSILIVLAAMLIGACERHFRRCLVDR